MKSEDVVIGKKYCIRQWDDMAKTCSYVFESCILKDADSYITFTKQMEPLCGTELVVSNMKSFMSKGKGFEYVEVFSNRGIEPNFYIAPWMLEEIEEKKPGFQLTLSKAFRLCNIRDEIVILKSVEHKPKPGWYDGMHFILSCVVRDTLDMKKIYVHRIEPVHSFSDGDFLGMCFTVAGISDDILSDLEYSDRIS